MMRPDRCGRYLICHGCNDNYVSVPAYHLALIQDQ